MLQCSSSFLNWDSNEEIIELFKARNAIIIFLYVTTTYAREKWFLYSWQTAIQLIWNRDLSLEKRIKRSCRSSNDFLVKTCRFLIMNPICLFDNNLNHLLFYKNTKSAWELLEEKRSNSIFYSWLATVQANVQRILFLILIESTSDGTRKFYLSIMEQNKYTIENLKKIFFKIIKVYLYEQTSSWCCRWK